MGNSDKTIAIVAVVGVIALFGFLGFVLLTRQDRGGILTVAPNPTGGFTIIDRPS